GSRRASRLAAVGYRTGARACRGDAGAPRGPGARGRRHRLRRRAPLARGAQGAAARRGAQAVRGAFLDEMAEASRERMRAAKQTRSEAALEAAARQSPAPPPLRLDRSGFDLIAEVKLRSPGSGRLGPRAEDVAARVTAYARAGAAAISVLTEPSRFDGSLEHLASAARALAPHAVPAMRKDFLVDPYQVLEARAAGAGGVLVIVRMLSRSAIDALLAGGALMQAEDPQGLAGAVLAAGRAAAKAEAT